jgi:hypothetical protein
MKKTAATIGALALAFGLAACTDANRYGERDDATITAEVERELTNEGIAGTIDVAAYDGVVTLNGTVPNVEAKDRAADIADDVDGVDRVENNLRTTMAGDAPEPLQGQRPYAPDGAMNPPAEQRPDAGAPPAPEM